ncbi:uncharacterized protein LOC100369951, partial [Saccoglossus kowalevskii]|uniref:Urease accessory protein D-like n=1 Tax=Saccoglossus kowalevskii TaxID=10224 RepID=A0ABM0LZZ1_SACKO
MQGFEITEDLLSKEDDQLNARPCVTGIAQFHPKAESNEADCYGNRKSYVCKLYFTYPLKLMVPKYAGSSNTQWLYPITYGGGLVAGDHIDLDVTVGDGCSVLITTQGSTKVYKSVNNLISMQGIDAKVNNGGLLAILPDPVVCYQNARYAQTQVWLIETQ